MIAGTSSALKSAATAMPEPAAAAAAAAAAPVKKETDEGDDEPTQVEREALTGVVDELMHGMFGAVALAVDGPAQGTPRQVVAARRKRARELKEREERESQQQLAREGA